MQVTQAIATVGAKADPSVTASQQQPPNTAQQQQGQQEVRAVYDDLLRASDENERDALIMRLRFLEKRLGVVPNVVAVCPECRKRHNVRGNSAA